MIQRAAKSVYYFLIAHCVFVAAACGMFAAAVMLGAPYGIATFIVSLTLIETTAAVYVGWRNAKEEMEFRKRIVAAFNEALDDWRDEADLAEFQATPKEERS